MDGLNSPFTWKPQNSQPPYKKAVLLIHGLLDSPYAMQDLGRHFLRKGFLVHATLLAGHGTTAGDLIGIRFVTWCQQIQQALKVLQTQANKIIICGFSLGSSLAIYTTLTCADLSKNIEKLILFAPALRSTNLLKFMSNWHTAISWAIKRAHWYRIRPSHCPTRYESIPFNALHQTRLLVKIIRKRLYKQNLAQPLLIVMSTDDETICSGSVLRFFHSHTHADSRLIVYSNEPLILSDARIIHRKSAFPTENIIDFSHTALHIAPNNAVFGRMGSYQDFLHYTRPPRIYHKPLKLGAVTRRNLKKYTIQRLSYNPDFEFVLKQIDRFLET